MKRFISTKFFLTMQKASQKGVGVDINVLENSYEEFVRLLFQEGATSTDKAAHHNTLIYTRVELSSLIPVSGKKCGNFSSKSY